MRMAGGIRWLDLVATGSYHAAMVKVSIKEAKDRLSELGRLVEEGEQVVITRNGEEKFELVLHKKKGGTNWEAGEAYLKSLGITRIASWIAPDFDDPLPEDFLITPLPADFDEPKDYEKIKKDYEKKAQSKK